MSKVPHTVLKRGPKATHTPPWSSDGVGSMGAGLATLRAIGESCRGGRNGSVCATRRAGKVCARATAPPPPTTKVKSRAPTSRDRAQTGFIRTGTLQKAPRARADVRIGPGGPCATRANAYTAHARRRDSNPPTAAALAATPPKPCIAEPTRPESSRSEPGIHIRHT